jgi:phosphoribosylformylglycinamidine synthase
LEKERALHHAVRGFIACGLVKSAHDCSEGGLAVALAESCISRQIARDTPRLMGAQIDLSAAAPDIIRLDALLFGETQGRVILSVAPMDAVKVVERAKILGVGAVKLGTTGGAELAIRRGAAECKWAVAQLHDLWWNAIARAMQ